MSQPARPTRVNRNAVACTWGRNARVRRHRNTGAGSSENAIDSCNDRLRTQAHLQNKVRRHARELKEFVGSHAGKRTYELVHITAGAEVSAGARDHDRFDFIGRLQAAKESAQLCIGVKGQRVLALGAI
jgi:hypothetical protein